jgi:hypothetical protein
VPSRADAPPEAESDMALVFGVGGCGLQRPGRGVEMPSRVEEVGVWPEGARVTVDGPDVGDEKGAFGDEVAVVQNILVSGISSRSGIEADHGIGAYFGS